VYQPVINLDDGAVTAAEALARFGDGSDPPDRWFAKAAGVGLDRELELEVITRAVGALALLPASTSVAVNVSPSLLLDPALARLLARCDCPRIILELTEHVAVENYDAVTTAFGALREAGARLAVDDAGAGYAGFRHLLALKPSIIKLDMSLTRGIAGDPVRRALAAALVAFTGETGTELVAEGVETADELDTLRSLGVRQAQGYHLGRPVDLDEVISTHRLQRAG
jgi:EAL domain-containing protein (putative c-di-GMP-specific phosphodiesterase class I)